MSSFDESKHPRNRGRFTAVTHGEPEVSIGPAFDARYWGLPEWRPGNWVFGSTAAAPIVAGSVVDGPLSRAGADRESISSFERWMADADNGTPVGDEFAAGLVDGLRALTRSDADASTAAMLESVASGPQPHHHLTSWQLGMRSAATKAGYRGQLAAGVILSGADKWWGIAENMDLAVMGPAEDIKPVRGAWVSLGGS